MITPLEYTGGKIRFLDQTKLPGEEVYCETDDVRVIEHAIKRLAIRGAPLIGIAAAYGVVLVAEALAKSHDSSRKKIEEAVVMLRQSRPTAVNLFRALDRQSDILKKNASVSMHIVAAKLLNEANAIHNEDKIMCEKISRYGADILQNGMTVLTHCNAGALATGGKGTAVGVIEEGWKTGKIEHVFIDETRPLFQGARLTVWELSKLHIPSTLIADNTAAFLMQQQKIHAVIVGADRIAKNGDTANKIGTYNLAVLAHFHHIPFYVAAPTSTFDLSLNDGHQIPIEQRDPNEVRIIHREPMTMPSVPVYSPAFDVTPHELITGIITDRGVCSAPFDQSIIAIFDKQ